MRNSEIFDNFVKIAEETGLMSSNRSEEAKKELESTRRADSLSVAQIAKLYGIKPDAPKDMQYERNIVEKAHPTSLVIAPSYDKLNGLVENVNERQDILLHIVNKNNNGYLTNTKYARRELLLSLVRIGNDLDNRGQAKLVALTDACLAQASVKGMKKEALWPLAILVASLLGGLYAKQHLAFHSDGFEVDIQKAISELDDLINSNSNWGVGYQYKPQLIALANDVKNKLHELSSEVQKMSALLDTLQQPKTGKELIQSAQQPDNQKILHALQEFKSKFNDELLPYFQQVVKNFTNETYKQQQVDNKGFLTQIVDSTEVLHGGKGLIADDFDDVAHALRTVLSDVENVVKGLQEADATSSSAQQQLQAATVSTPDAAAPTAAPTAEAPTSGEPDGTPPLASLEQEFGDLTDPSQLM